MTHIHSFPPISDARAEVLILGSMPGKVSLQRSQYYAHPRNLFWRIIKEITGIPSSESYEMRCDMLKQERIAVWDTLKSCTRTSSLDSDIDDSTIVPNDFSTFLRQHPAIRLICFNGAKSEAVFSRQVAPHLGDLLGQTRLERLPSTSPANASITFESKLDQWRVIAS